MAEFASHFSVLPLLFGLQLLAIHLAVRHGVKFHGLERPGWIYGLIGLLGVWGIASTWLAYRGGYESPAFLASYPVVWLPMVPVVLVVAPLVLFEGARQRVRALIDSIPVVWIVGIHALRILAVGTLIKAWNGEFSASFATFVGIPDMAFGLSAVVMIWLAVKNRISAGVLLAWNIAGVLVILPGAAIVGQMGLPGVLHSFNETPSVTTLFEFPMVLGPSLVVPIFIAFNLLVAVRLFERSVSMRNEIPMTT